MKLAPGRASLCAFALLAALCQTAVAGDHVFSVKDGRTLLDGKPFLVAGLRVSNALISDEAANQLIANLDAFKSYGVNTVSVFFMGSRFGDIRGYRQDGSLDPVYAARMGRIIEAVDKRGMVVLVGCLYWSTSRAKWESWTQREANAAVAATARWLQQREYRNVFIDVDNEGMALKEAGFDNRQLVLAAKRAVPSVVVGTNYKGQPPPEADLALHFSERAPGKPYIQSEGSPSVTPLTGANSGYWGRYSKQDGLYQYINIGVYTPEMKRDQIEDTLRHLRRGEGYIMASTWLQCVPPDGPNHTPGGQGTVGSPGIRWWLESLREILAGLGR
jgi:hypothetical protein